jgi:copper(I)-binding protein
MCAIRDPDAREKPVGAPAGWRREWALARTTPSAAAVMLERAASEAKACLAGDCRRRSVMNQVTATPVGSSGGPRARRAPGRRRRSLLGLGAVALAVLLALSACNEGQDAPVTAGVPDVANAHGGVASMVLDVVFIESGGTVEAGQSAPIRGNFTNDAETADRLVGVSSPAAGSVQLLDADGLPSAQGIDIPAHGQVDAVNGEVRLQLVDASFPLPATQLVPVTFEFSGAGSVTLDVPVAAPQAPAP